MKKITESQLKDRVNRLKEYMAVVENDQYANESAGALLAKYGGKAVDAVKGAGSAIASGAQKFFGSTAGKVAGAAEDENIDGTLTSTVQIFRPSGANVTLPAPTASSTVL